jgi:Ni,Fe-hydrogenase III small subunit/formate hydrogenlyase subunit 6/NADH:ubiquinone oxidoreductase subunit I
MLRILIDSLRTGVVTTRYPEQPSVPPARFRGAPVLAPGSHLPPPAVCPSGAITERHEGGERLVALDLARCVFCGRCAEDPWAGAVTIGRDFELAARRRADLRIEVVADGAPAGAATAPAPDPDEEAARAAAEIHRVLGRSLHLRHLDAGSCNACDWELSALLNPVYDVRRLGIDFVASPRHADGVAVTGPVTRNLETAVRRTVEAVPEPRLVIAVGACAASGGIVGEGYASAGGVDRVLPVDVYVPGCPPRPEAIIFGLLVALGRLDARR